MYHRILVLSITVFICKEAYVSYIQKCRLVFVNSSCIHPVVEQLLLAMFSVYFTL